VALCSAVVAAAVLLADAWATLRAFAVTGVRCPWRGLLLAREATYLLGLINFVGVLLCLVGVLFSLLVVWLGHPLFDPLAGIAVAILIGHTSYEIARDTTGILADRVVIDEEQIRDAVMGVAGVLGCHHIRTRGSLDHVFLDLHVWLPADAPLRDAHQLSHVVKDRLMERFPQIVDAIIHIEPPPPD